MVFVARSNFACASAALARSVSGLNTDESRLISTLPNECASVFQSPYDQVRRRHGKIDRVAAIALNAISPFVELLETHSSGLEVGVFIGNMLGGWEFGERELETLYREGANRVSAFQATAWFPAAAQGEISIAHSLMGYSKTMSGGLACGLEAFLIAYDALTLGKIDIAIVGACEALTSSFSISGLLDIKSKVIGEAACFFLLSRFPLGISTPLALEWHQSPKFNFGSIAMDYGEVAQIDLLDRMPFYLAAQPLIELAKIIASASASNCRKYVKFSAGNAIYSFEIDSSA